MNGNTGDGEESKPDFGAMQRPNDGGGFGAYGSDDVKLKYTGDELSSYTNIWDSAKTDITETDQTRLIESLKKLSSYEDIESVVDIDEVIRYFVVHNYVCNGDSYTGSMIHNYYLYEKDGVMSMIPWDYNLAFGTFQGGDANSTINTPIDSPISGGSSSDRPMWDWILSDEKYTEKYHHYFEEFLTSVDISTIILGHSAIYLPDYVLDSIEKRLNRISLFRYNRTIKIFKSRFEDNGPLLGSACNVFVQLFSGMLSQ